MSNDLKFYRELDEKMFLKIGYETEPLLFSYYKSNSEITIELDDSPELNFEDNTFLISDKYGKWTPDEYGLNIYIKFYLNNPSFLFGPKGIVQYDAVIGLAVNWYSKSSNQRGVEKLGSLRKSNHGRYTATHKLEFNKKQLTGDVTLELMMFLEEPSVAESPEFASKTGTILGWLDSKKIIIDGQSSEFPITEVNAPEYPLWFVTFDYTDPMSDSFSEENVCINLNTAHKNFNLISGKKEQADNPMLTEIISGALQVIVQKVLEGQESEDIMNGRGYEEGSIGEAVHYFLTTFNWDTSSPEKLAKSIRQDWENRIGGEQI